MSEARHKVTGVVVSGSEATLRRLGPGWEIKRPESEGKPAKKSAKSPRKK